MRFLSVVGEVLFIPILRKVGDHLYVAVGGGAGEGGIVYGGALVGVIGNRAKNCKWNVIHKADVTDATALHLAGGGVEARFQIGLLFGFNSSRSPLRGK